MKNIQNTNITAKGIDVLPLTKLITGDINMVTATFVKAYFISYPHTLSAKYPAVRLDLHEEVGALIRQT